uniref:Putative secreted protein n=1 Tax=Anopheles darlingi TaxID=43151 RepID=A0A2M4D4N5_ANODA
MFAPALWFCVPRSVAHSIALSPIHVAFHSLFPGPYCSLRSSLSTRRSPLAAFLQPPSKNGSSPRAERAGSVFLRPLAVRIAVWLEGNGCLVSNRVPSLRVAGVRRLYPVHCWHLDHRARSADRYDRAHDPASIPVSSSSCALPCFACAFRS